MKYVSSGLRKWASDPVTAAQTPHGLLTTTSPAGMIHTEGWQGAEFMVFGDTEDDDTDLVLYHVSRTAEKPGGTPVYMVRPFVLVETIEIGTTAGLAGDDFPSASELFADTYTTVTVLTNATTPRGPGTKLLVANNGVAGAYSPANDEIGHIYISDLANAYGILPQFETLNTGNYFGIAYNLLGTD